MVMYLIKIQSSLVDYFKCKESERAGYPVAKYRTLSYSEYMYRMFGQERLSISCFIPNVSYKSMDLASQEFLEKSK